MKFLITFLLLLTASLSAFGERFQTRVHSIIRSDEPARPHIVRLENGRVAFVEKGDARTVFGLQMSRKRGDLVEVDLDGKFRLLSALTLEDRRGPAPKRSEDYGPLLSYEPTVLPSLAAATAIFRLMRRDHQRDSQCYNRAHVWAYEEFRRSGLNSQKLFMFFTSRYIWNYNYKWWFHVTPMVLTTEDGAVVERALDRTFTSRPLLRKAWSDIFIKSKRECPVVRKYSDYENHQQEEDCYHIPVTMYYWQPRDIDANERTGAEKTSFIDWEVDWAYDEAF